MMSLMGGEWDKKKKIKKAVGGWVGLGRVGREEGVPMGIFFIFVLFVLLMF